MSDHAERCDKCNKWHESSECPHCAPSDEAVNEVARKILGKGAKPK